MLITNICRKAPVQVFTCGGSIHTKRKQIVDNLIYNPNMLKILLMKVYVFFCSHICVDKNINMITKRLSLM